VHSKFAEGFGMPQVQHLRVALDNRNAFRGNWFGKVLQFGVEDAIQPSISFPRSARSSAKNVARPHTTLCSFCPLPQS
jgi:hypothetical protein